MKCSLVFVLLAALTLVAGATNPAHAVALTGSGPHLVFPPTASPLPMVLPTYVQILPLYTGFTGTWGADAAADWQGTFTATGPVPASPDPPYLWPAGNTRYDFTGLNLRGLPAHSYFNINDLDSGSGQEHFTGIRAYDLSNNLITSPWLEEPLWADSNGTGLPVLLTDTPGWDWSVTSPSTYTFDGTTVGGNPTVRVVLENNQPIGYLEFSRDLQNNSFHITAPAVPEPSTLALAAAGGLALLAVAWRRRQANAGKSRLADGT